MGMLKNKYYKITIGIIISFSVLFAMYFAISFFFLNHFYFGSTVSCISISGKTVDEVNEQIPDAIEKYTLELKERGNNKEQIRGADINLKYNPNGKVQELKDKQNAFKWVSALFNTKDFEITQVVTYNEKLLKDYFNELACVDSNNVSEPENPAFQYKNGVYTIVNEVPGNKINKDVLYDMVKNAILNGETTIDLDANGCYESPQYLSTSKEVIDTRDILNKYVSSKITYSFANKTKVLDGSITNAWLSVNDKLEVTFDEKKINSYLDELADEFNTVGTTRDFVTTLGKTIKVSGGDYGWRINKSEEARDLISDIKEGQSITKEPIYMQAAISHDDNDIGKTYVEINMSKQHLWFYKNGSLVVDGDVVTGNASNNHSTPTGIYKLKYKQKDAILKGEGYNTPVNFWMPFNGGIGIHDASWRSVFGGNIYRTSGSHGCVNAPYNLANSLFNSVDEGIPVVCYY